MNPIDAHSHLFNLKYLPVAGIIRRYSNELVPHIIARGVEWLLIAKTAASYEEEREAAKKDSRSLKHVPIVSRLDVQKEYTNIEVRVPSIDRRQLFDMNQSDLVDLIADKLTEADVQSEALQSALNEYRKQPDVAPQLLAEDSDFKISAFRDNSPAILMRGRNLFRRMIDWVFDKINGGLNFLRWFAFMTHSEKAILTALQADEHSPSPVTKFLHLMMDVDYFFTDSRGFAYRSTYDFETEQIPNFRQLNKEFNNLLIGFVAFNPSRPNSLDIIKDALSDGFKGVKFYPPLGYRATDNDDPEFEKRIADLFDYCELNNYPVFTHCNNGGFEAFPRDNSGYDASPIYWEKVLTRHPKLRICFGHSGGVEGWFTENRPGDKSKAADISSALTKNDSAAQEADWNASYAALVFKLCVQFDNAYCDASYLDEMVTPSGAIVEIPASNFRTRLVKLFTDEPKFAKKIMYGSDWHMLFKEAKNATFYSTYATFFADPTLAPFANDFFENNVRTFLKI